MSVLIKTTLLGLFFGMFGTSIGGIIGSIISIKSNKLMSFILEFSAGLMTAIICFELIPEALEISNIAISIFGIALGVGSMIICDNFVNKKFQNEKNALLKTGLIVGIGLAIHNFPEGLAIGSGFGASLKLGYTLAIAIAFHDIPEGISMSVPMKNGGLGTKKAIFYTMISGITTGIGAFFGSAVGNISEKLIGISLAFAAGAMLYIVSGELIPESKKIYKGRFSIIGNIIGFIMGLFAMNI